MGYLNSIREEYDDDGNYVGNSNEGNRFHGVAPARRPGVIVCAACGSAARRAHPCGGTICANCGCGEARREYRR